MDITNEESMSSLSRFFWGVHNIVPVVATQHSPHEELSKAL